MRAVPLRRLTPLRRPRRQKAQRQPSVHRHEKVMLQPEGQRVSEVNGAPADRASSMQSMQARDDGRRSESFASRQI